MNCPAIANGQLARFFFQCWLKLSTLCTCTWQAGRLNRFSIGFWATHRSINMNAINFPKLKTWSRADDSLPCVYYETKQFTVVNWIYVCEDWSRGELAEKRWSQGELWARNVRSAKLRVCAAINTNYRPYTRTTPECRRCFSGSLTWVWQVRQPYPDKTVGMCWWTIRGEVDSIIPISRPDG